LQDKHGITIEAYETGARAGHTIRDILEEMASKSSFAILIMTGEDEQADGALRARQNVIHEAGLFQGRLGFPRAILLIEEGVDLFSNVEGVQYIRFSKGNIKETFGEILATLRREFPQ
jgi:predicted nucleotide-binding protein